MDTALLAARVLLLLLVCSLGPGLLIVGRLRCSPMEKLCGAFAASFIAVYLASFALFCVNAPIWIYAAVSLMFAAMAVAGWRTARLFLKHKKTRSALFAWIVVLGWDFLHLSMVRHYGGGGWGGDWSEHFNRVQFFLHQLPNDFRFLELYQLPARPPMMNLIAALICRQTGLNFESFSLIFLFLNAFAFLPCCLLLSIVAKRGRKFIPILAALFMLNPSVMENATLTVTKAFAAAWVILGVCLYLRRRIPAAAACLAAGVLVHYSAAPYALAVGLHYVFTFFSRRRPLREAVLATAAAILLLSTWLGWSIHTFGIKTTFSPEVGGDSVPAASAPGILHRTLYNIFVTIVPHPFHAVPGGQFQSLANLGDVNDYYFTMTEQTLPMIAGLTGGLVALLIFLRRPDRRFWLFFSIFSFVAGVAANGDMESYGFAQITLQALSMMLLTLLATRLATLPRWISSLVVAGAAVDYALGVLLLFDRESYAYPTVVNPNGTLTILPDPTLGRFGAADFIQKIRAGYIFWADHWPNATIYLEITSVIIALFTLHFLSRVIFSKSQKFHRIHSH